MSALTNHAENKILDALLRGQALGAPATLYFALFTSDPTETGAAGTEVTGGSYARASLTASLANISGTQGAGTTAVSSGTGGTVSNNVTITFPAPTANWGSVTHMAVFDAASGGNCWLYGAVTGGPIVINSGQQAPIVDPGTWSFQIDN